MCGRYVLVMVQHYLEDHDLPVHDAPDDDGSDAPRTSYNFAPGHYGAVYRADVPDRGADAPSHPSEAAGAAPRYKLQAMKWGLVPSWTKRSPDYASMLKTINCRSDSLAGTGGLWSSMKGRKRCVVLADGFYEWLRVGPKERVPHYIKRKDGQPMLFAGLWDCVQYEDNGEKLYTYTIITVDSNPQLKFLHDRMPAILEPSSPELLTWVDPTRTAWSRELQDVLRPSAAELEVYPVSKEVGKVGNDSPSFVIPVASRENKGNIANFFANARKKGAGAEKEVKKEADGGQDAEVKKETDKGQNTEIKDSEREEDTKVKKEADRMEDAKERGGTTHSSAKRGASPPDRGSEPPAKIAAASPKKKISATSNGSKAPVRQSPEGSRKITSFFAKKE